MRFPYDALSWSTITQSLLNYYCNFMANTLTSLLPTLIAERSIEFLRSRSGFLGRIYTETTQENILRGGSSVIIPKPSAAFTPTNVSYSSAATPQDITINSTTLNFSYHKEIKVAANQLESRISQGNFRRILELTMDGMLEGLVTTIDQSVAALYSSATITPVGTPGAALTDVALRSAAASLANHNVNIQGGNTYLVVTPSDYYNGILGVDRYVTALNVGGTEAIRGGRIPSLFNINVDYSPNVAVTSASPATNHNMMFEKYAFVIGFVEFEPASTYGPNTNVTEEIMTDPATGISLRVQKYFDPSVRTWYYQMDVKWGVAVLDANRFIEVKS